MAIDSEKVKVIKEWLGTGSINIFGVPFAGKDTQGKKLADLFSALFISSGDVLRNHATVSAEAKNTISQGFLAPTDEFIKIITPYLSQEIFKNKPMILSSVGRWQGEEQSIIKATDDSGHPIKAVVFIKIGEKTARERLEKAKQLADRGKRSDDDSEALTTRFEEFWNKTFPVLEFYKQKGLMFELDGNQAPDLITEQIVDKLFEFTTRKA